MTPHQYKIVAIDSITLAENNPRTHSEKQIEQLRASIREFGFTNPVLIDENANLIAGHGRLFAADAEGMNDVPAIVVAGLNETQRRALVIADNKLALNAGWDMLILSKELEALQLNAFNMPLTGFDTSELKSLLGRFDPVTDGEQSHLDTKAKIVCPECGHEFDSTGP